MCENSITKHLLILAGGKGTRLGELTKTTPKPIITVGGNPFLVWLLRWAIYQKFTHVIIATGFIGNKVEATIGHSFQSLHISYSREDRPLGTGGAIINALHLLPEQFVCINGDSLCDVGLLSFSATPNIIVCESAPDRATYGTIKGKDSIVTEFTNHTLGGFINTGIYYFSKSNFLNFPNGTEISLEKEIFPEWTKKHLLHYTQKKSTIYDIGTPSGLKATEQYLKYATYLRTTNTYT